MKTYFLAAAAMLAVPTAADAAVTIRFADPTVGNGVITIDTEHLGTATVDGSTGRTRYSGDGSAFLTASFIDRSGDERLLQVGALDGYIEFDATSGDVSVGYSDGTGTPAVESLIYLTATGTQAGSFEGVALPDFATATSLFFTIAPSDGGDTFDGQAASISMTSSVSPVPEPATWALMIAGFAATGAALRRRRSSVATA